MPLLRLLLFTALALAGCVAPASRDAILPLPPPRVLFDGRDASAWAHVNTGLPCTWLVADRTLVVRPGTGSIRTRAVYDDFTLFVEFLVPEMPAVLTGQTRGNSGVYLHNRYEIQILDSWGLPPDAHGCGAIYGRRAPDVNASRPPEEWQTFLIRFTAARFDDDGRKTENARLTVHHNGVLIHDDVEVEGRTGMGEREAPGPGPIVLQDHGNPVGFRRVWIDPR